MTEINESTDPPITVPTGAAALLRERDYVLFWVSRFTASLGALIQSVSLQWQVYNVARHDMDVKRAAFMVSMLGLISFLPVFFLALPAGEMADRHDRRRILLFCNFGELISAGLLIAAALSGFATLPFLLGLALLFGVSRSFFSPASSAMGPMLVPRALLPRAIAWNSLTWQSAAIAGPVIGGFLVAHSPALAYAVGLALYAIAFLCVLSIRKPTKPQVQPGSRWELVKEGLAYVWGNKIVFGSISLDLFAVLLGGATALLPVFARDVLHVGPQGFGLLRSGAAMGAAPMAAYLAVRPIRRKAGMKMFTAVAIFGLFTLIFGLSKWLWLSVLCLAVLGAADMISVYIRQTLVQIVTPDHMRGRVATVSSLFIGASNELGEFESGVAARLLGPVGAVVFGGIGSMVVTGLWSRLFPALRKADSLE